MSKKHFLSETIEGTNKAIDTEESISVGNCVNRPPCLARFG